MARTTVQMPVLYNRDFTSIRPKSMQYDAAVKLTFFGFSNINSRCAEDCVEPLRLEAHVPGEGMYLPGYYRRGYHCIYIIL
jgi:hypothetical protein